LREEQDEAFKASLAADQELENRSKQSFSSDTEEKMNEESGDLHRNDRIEEIDDELESFSPHHKIDFKEEKVCILRIMDKQP